jgi:hypothetical protein
MKSSLFVQLLSITIACIIPNERAVADTFTTTKFSPNSNLITINPWGGTISIKRSNKVNDFLVSTNCPSHWKIGTFNIMQLAMTYKKNGFLVQRSEDNKLYVIQNSTGYEIPTDKHAYCINVPNDAEHALKVINNQLLIGAASISPLTVKNDYVQPTEDILEVTIPDSYLGGLRLNCMAGSVVDLNRWKGGTLFFDLKKDCTLKTGSMENVEKSELNAFANSHISISKLDSKVTNVFVDKLSSLQIDAGNSNQVKIMRATGKVALPRSFKVIFKGPRDEVQISP